MILSRMDADRRTQSSLVSVVEDVLQQHGKRLNDFDFASRREQEAASRRNEAAAWVRKMVGHVCARELPDQPSDEEFKLALRSGIILLNVLNKVNPGAVPKAVEAPADSIAAPGGAALSVFQYFENVRNFLVSVEEMGLPSFEASDLEKGGKSSRIVNCILALKSYCNWKQAGSIGSFKFSGNQKPASLTKQFIRRNASLFTKALVRNSSAEERSTDSLPCEESTSCDDENDSLTSLVRELLQDKKQEEIPIIVQRMLSKVIEEFEQKLTLQKEQSKTTSHDMAISDSAKPLIEQTTSDNTAISDSAKPLIEKTTSDNTAISDSAKSLVEKTTSDDTEISDSAKFVVEKTTSDNTAISDSAKSSVEKTTSDDTAISDSAKSPVEIVPQIVSNGVKSPTKIPQQDDYMENEPMPMGVATSEEEVATSEELAVKISRLVELCNDKNEALITLRRQCDRWKMLTEKYQGDVQKLKNILNAAKADAHFLKTQYQEEFSNLGNHLHGLTHAAQGYKKVLEENRKLYNVIQDLKGNIRVYCRVRPFLPGEANSVNAIGSLDDGSITIVSPSKNGKDARKTFTFNKVFGSSATQVEVFADTQPLIRSVLDGYNVCIFAYGQTGSGKTYTMSGPDDITDESAGVNYRALGDLFLISEQRKEFVAYDVSVQMIEIYNEQVRDLLNSDGGNKRLEIRNNTQNGISVPDANIVPVSTTSDVIKLMNLGHKNRAVGSTSMNNRSSRSHSCLTVHVQGRDVTSGSVVRGCMHLVDLAGSERADKTEAVGERLKEATFINKSLSALGDVIASLGQKNAHVPYRNSKLTQLLQDSLGGQAKTLMFVHISPEPDSVGETLSTLKFAERVSSVELGAAKANKDSSSAMLSKTRSLDSNHSQTNSPSLPPNGSPRGGEDSRQSPESFGDIDDLDAATDSSEQDYILETNIPRVSSLPDGLGNGMKSKKTGTKLANGQDRRGSIPPTAKRKILNAISPLSQKTGKSSVRKPVSGK